MRGKKAVVFRGRNWTRKIAASVALILLCLGAGWFVQTEWITSGDLRHGLWAPSYLLIRGENPYGFGAPDQGVKSVWFPMVIGLFVLRRLRLFRDVSGGRPLAGRLPT